MKYEWAIALKKPLNGRQHRFVEEYLVDLNGAQAVVRAGYSKTGADVTAVRLLADPRIKSLVEEGKAQLSHQTGLSKAWLVGKVKGVFELAVSDKHHAAVGRLGELLARMQGWTVETRNLRVIRSIEDLSDTELKALVGE